MATKTNAALSAALVEGFRAFGKTQTTLAQVVALPVTRTASILTDAATALSGDVKTGETVGPFFDLRRSARRAANNAGRMVKMNRANDGAVTVKVATLEDVTEANGWSASDVERARKLLEPKTDDTRAPQQGKGAGKGKGKAESEPAPAVGGIESPKTFAALNKGQQSKELRKAADALFDLLEAEGRDPLETAAELAAHVAERAERIAERIAERDAQTDAQQAAA